MLQRRALGDVHRDREPGGAAHAVLEPDGSRCFQLMEATDREALDVWIGRWNHVMDFEVIPVVTSAEAVATLAPRV